jgi:hypothetical protein
MELRVKGHRLHVGGQCAYHEEELRAAHRTRTAGSAVCECGAYSPVLPSAIDRAQWHREHVMDVISGKTRLL